MNPSNPWGSRGAPFAEMNATIRATFGAYWLYETEGSDDFPPRPILGATVDYSQHLTGGQWYYDAPEMGSGDNASGGRTPLRYHPAIARLSDCPQNTDDATGAPDCYKTYLITLEGNIFNPTLGGIVYHRLGYEFPTADLASMVAQGGGVLHVTYDAQNGYIMRRDEYETYFGINDVSTWSVLRPVTIFAAMVVAGAVAAAQGAGAAASEASVGVSAGEAGALGVETAGEIAGESALTDLGIETAGETVASDVVGEQIGGELVGEAVGETVGETVVSESVVSDLVAETGLTQEAVTKLVVKFGVPAATSLLRSHFAGHTQQPSPLATPVPPAPIVYNLPQPPASGVSVPAPAIAAGLLLLFVALKPRTRRKAT